MDELDALEQRVEDAHCIFGWYGRVDVRSFEDEMPEVYEQLMQDEKPAEDEKLMEDEKPDEDEKLMEDEKPVEQEKKPSAELDEKLEEVAKVAFHAWHKRYRKSWTASMRPAALSQDMKPEEMAASWLATLGA